MTKPHRLSMIGVAGAVYGTALLREELLPQAQQRVTSTFKASAHGVTAIRLLLE
jgi:hypothetical protein